MLELSGHIDTLVIDRLPPREAWPDLRFDLPELQYASRINVAQELLSGAIGREFAARTALRGEGDHSWTYAQLLEQSQRVAHVLTQEMRLVSGNRVLLHGYNGPMMAAAWFGVLMAWGIAVTTMPMLRNAELAKIGSKAKIDIALSDHRLAGEVESAADVCGGFARRITFGNGVLESSMQRYGQPFNPVDRAQRIPRSWHLPRAQRDNLRQPSTFIAMY